jgi:recombinational DNA repair protein (RecF pathway)
MKQEIEEFRTYMIDNIDALLEGEQIKQKLFDQFTNHLDQTHK